MKLDIEAMAREAGAVKERDETFGTAYEFELPQLETFARLIVERCAQECAKQAKDCETWDQGAGGGGGRVASHMCESAIRNLLEDQP